MGGVWVKAPVTMPGGAFAGKAGRVTPGFAVGARAVAPSRRGSLPVVSSARVSSHGGTRSTGALLRCQRSMAPGTLASTFLWSPALAAMHSCLSPEGSAFRAYFQPALPA